MRSGGEAKGDQLVTKVVILLGVSHTLAALQKGRWCDLELFLFKEHMTHEIAKPGIHCILTLEYLNTSI